jgi:hypothetical protein
LKEEKEREIKRLRGCRNIHPGALHSSQTYVTVSMATLKKVSNFSTPIFGYEERIQRGTVSVHHQVWGHAAGQGAALLTAHFDRKGIMLKTAD